MDKTISLKRRFLNLIMLLSIVCYSFFGISSNLEKSFVKENEVPLGYSQSDAVVNLDHLAGAGELLQSSPKTELQSQLKVQSKSTTFQNWNICGIEPIYTVYLILLSFLSLCILVINNSHRFNLRFIHNKDGEKA